MRIGKCPENAYKRSVKKYLQPEILYTGQDQTITVVRQTALDHEMAPAVFLQDAINAACAQDAKITGISVSLALGEQAEEAEISSLMKQLARVANAERIPLTEAAVSTFAGLGKAVLQIAVRANRNKAQMPPLKAGDLLLIGPIALGGTGILAVEKEERLLERFAKPFVKAAADFLAHLSVADAAELAFGTGAEYAYALGEGGVFAGLWELADSLGLGLCVDLKAITIRQETVELCECFRINPYQFLSTGALLVVAKDGKRFCKELQQKGLEVSLIGSLQEGNDRIIRNDGETRYLDLPQKDELYGIS